MKRKATIFVWTVDLSCSSGLPLLFMHNCESFDLFNIPLEQCNAKIRHMEFEPGSEIVWQSSFKKEIMIISSIKEAAVSKNNPNSKKKIIVIETSKEFTVYANLKCIRIIKFNVTHQKLHCLIFKKVNKHFQLVW